MAGWQPGQVLGSGWALQQLQDTGHHHAGLAQDPKGWEGQCSCKAQAPEAAMAQHAALPRHAQRKVVPTQQMMPVPCSCT